MLKEFWIVFRKFIQKVSCQKNQKQIKVQTLSKKVKNTFNLFYFRMTQSDRKQGMCLFWIYFTEVHAYLICLPLALEVTVACSTRWHTTIKINRPGTEWTLELSYEREIHAVLAVLFRLFRVEQLCGVSMTYLCTQIAQLVARSHSQTAGWSSHAVRFLQGYEFCDGNVIYPIHPLRFRHLVSAVGFPLTTQCFSTATAHPRQSLPGERHGTIGRQHVFQEREVWFVLSILTGVYEPEQGRRLFVSTYETYHRCIRQLELWYFLAGALLGFVHGHGQVQHAIVYAWKGMHWRDRMRSVGGRSWTCRGRQTILASNSAVRAAGKPVLCSMSIARVIQQPHHLGGVFTLQLHLGARKGAVVVPFEPVQTLDDRCLCALERIPLLVEEWVADAARINATTTRR